MFMSETKFAWVLRIYTYLSKIYESVVTGTYFWKQDN